MTTSALKKSEYVENVMAVLEAQKTGMHLILVEKEVGPHIVPTDDLGDFAEKYLNGAFA